jgi:hypothetical protein
MIAKLVACADNDEVDDEVVDANFDEALPLLVLVVSSPPPPHADNNSTAVITAIRHATKYILAGIVSGVFISWFRCCLTNGRTRPSA